MKVVILVLFIASLGLSHGKIVLDDLSIVTDEKIVTVQKTINKDDEGKISAAFETELHQDLSDNLYFTSLTSAMVDDKYMPILRIEPIPICKFMNNPHPPAVMKFALVMLRSFGDIPDKCPIKKGHYSLKDLELDSNMMIPMMPNGKFMLEMMMMLKEGDQWKQFSKTTLKAAFEGGE